MTCILVVEDDDAIRNNVVRLLKLEGYYTISAANGRLGLDCARQARPDIVITDVGMQEMDGFALVEAIRADRELAATSIMLLTALADRESMRRGMTAGADDYLAKPFTRVELLEAIEALLRKKGRLEHRIRTAVEMREEHLRRAFAGSPGATQAKDTFGLEQPAPEATGQVIEATVLISDIRSFTALAGKLSSSEAAQLLTEYFERSCEPVLANGGRHLKFIGDGLMAVFSDGSTGTPALPAARRAISAALGMVRVAHDFSGWLARRFAQRGLPAFAIGIGLHAGEVTLCRLGTALAKETTPIGDTVNVAARLEAASKQLGWTVVASSVVLHRAGAGVRTGGMTSLALRGKDGFVDVAELTGLDPTHQDGQNA